MHCRAISSAEQRSRGSRRAPLQERVLCRQCGIEKEIVVIAPNGVCSSCIYAIEHRNLSTILSGLRVDESYSGPALYLVVFENGAKIGFANNLRSRLSAYCSPWCRPIESVQAMAIPKAMLRKVERFALALFHGGRRTGEFVHLCRLAEVQTVFEQVAIAFNDELRHLPRFRARMVERSGHVDSRPLSVAHRGQS